eukprot:COSAG06_NODE_54134_length_296_cov_0.781726_1_plen_22_part_10
MCRLGGALGSTENEGRMDKQSE